MENTLIPATVVVCTRNRPRELESCLAALGRQTARNFDVLVVDNGSQPPVADICSRHGANHVREPRAGLCIARNAGARHASGEIIAYIDDDAVAEPEWLERLLAGFSDDAVAAVTGRIRYMEALGDSRCMSEVEKPEAGVLRPDTVFSRECGNWFALACFGGIGDGSNMAFRRTMFLASPGFDERLGRGRVLEGGDEHVLFMALLALGHRIAHVSGAIVRHPSPGTPGLAKSARMRERRAAIAQLGFLWNEFPARRPDILRHVAGAVTRRLRPRKGTGRQSVHLTYLEATRAVWNGIALYREARRDWAGMPRPDYGLLAPALESR